MCDSASLLPAVRAVGPRATSRRGRAGGAIRETTIPARGAVVRGWHGRAWGGTAALLAAGLAVGACVAEDDRGEVVDADARLPDTPDGEVDGETGPAGPAPCWQAAPERLVVCGAGCAGACDAQVQIPAGAFLMGCDGERPTPDSYLCSGLSSSTPLHTVYLAAYAIDKYEVTVGRYRTCVEAGACAPPCEGCLARVNLDASYLLDPANSDRPIICVSWAQAGGFCAREGRRLPTEAEWEKAARGGCEMHGDPMTCEVMEDAIAYVWGDDRNARFAGVDGVECDDGEPCVVNVGHFTAAGSPAPLGPVGTFPVDISVYGVHDMTGNAAEWVEDSYDPDAYERCSPECTNPVVEGDIKFHRGFSVDGLTLMLMPQSLTVYFRHDPLFGSPDDPMPLVGFRCASDME